jgi:hypothetical protein
MILSLFFLFLVLILIVSTLVLMIRWDRQLSGGRRGDNASYRKSRSVKFRSDKIPCQFASIRNGERLIWSHDGSFLFYAHFPRSADIFHLHLHESAAKAEFEIV